MDGRTRNPPNDNNTQNQDPKSPGLIARLKLVARLVKAWRHDPVGLERRKKGNRALYQPHSSSQPQPATREADPFDFSTPPTAAASGRAAKQKYTKPVPVSQRFHAGYDPDKWERPGIEYRAQLAAKRAADKIAEKEAREKTHKALFGADAQTRAAQEAKFMKAWAAPVVNLGSHTAQLVQENAARAAAMQRVAATMQRVAPAPPPTSTPAPASTPDPALTLTSTSAFGSTSAFSTPASSSAPMFDAQAPAPPAAAPAPTDPFARYMTASHNPWNASSAMQQVRVDSETDEQMGGVDVSQSRSQAPAVQQRQTVQQQQQQTQTQYPAFPPPPQDTQTAFASVFPSGSPFTFTQDQQHEVPAFPSQSQSHFPFTFSPASARAPEQTLSPAFAAPSPSPPTYTFTQTPHLPLEHLQHTLARCASPAAFLQLAELAHAAGYAVDARALVEGAWVMGREEGAGAVLAQLQATYGQGYGGEMAQCVQCVQTQQQNGEHAQQNGQQRQATFSLLYGAHGCPAPRVRALEAEVEVPIVLAEDTADQEEWWAAKAAALERREEYFDECDGDGDDEEDAFEVVVEHVQKTYQTYGEAQMARQKAIDLEAFARVGQSQRETFRNGYMALGMRYRGVKRARAVEASSHSFPSPAPPSSGGDVVSAPSSVPCDEEEERNVSPDDAEASSSSSDSGEEDDSDNDSDAGSAHSLSSRSTSSLSSRTRARARPSPYARASRAGTTARLVDSVVSFFARLGV